MGVLLKAHWASAIRSRRDPSRFLPQTIAHRGYKAQWPENSMGAFQGAVDVGAHALETDVHLSADGVVVLSHDPSLKRCFGVDKKISDCSWDYLSTLQTVAEPKQGLPRLRDLLAWLNKPGMESIWVLLDIKIDDEAEDLIGAIADTFEQVQGVKPWDQRVILGCWNATFIQTARRVLPSYPLVLIAWYLPYARHFLGIPNLGYNIVQRALVGPVGAHFLRRVRRDDRQLFAWTVNEVRWMEWCIRKNMSTAATTGQSHVQGPRLIDGVITDDPKLFLEVCDRWEEEADGARQPRRNPDGVVGDLKVSLQVAWQLLFFQVFAPLYYLHRRFIAKKMDLLTELDQGGSVDRGVAVMKSKPL